MKKIIITSGLGPADLGGPALSVKHLAEEFSRRGYSVKVLIYGWEKSLPTGLRHLWFFGRVWFNLHGVDWLLALDTFSVGWPTALGASLCRKKFIVRVGGDFLWEQFVERRQRAVILPEFYSASILAVFTWRERLIFRLTKWTLRHAAALVFNSDWLRQIWERPYDLAGRPVAVIDNFYRRPSVAPAPPARKIFLLAGRPLFLKNREHFAAAFAAAEARQPELTLVVGAWPRAEFYRRLAESYALVVPSLSEVNPNVVADAWAAGKPSLVTEHNGLSTAARRGAFFVNPLSETSMIEGIEKLAEEKNYQAVIETMKQTNLEHSWSTIADEYLALIKTL